MAKTAQQILEELRGEQGSMESVKKKKTPSFLDSLSHHVAQPFNRGLLALPSMLPGGDALMQSAEAYGFTDPEGEGATGPIARGSEIFGGAALPFGGITGYGAKTLGQGLTRNLMTRPVPTGMTAVAPQQSVMQNIAAQTALKPKTSAAMEGLASLGAGIAGETKPEDPMMREIMGGIGASLAPAAASYTLPAIGGRFLARKAPSLAPTTRASKLVQQNVTDPNEIVYGRVDPAGNEIVPPRLDPNSPIPPALQTEEPRLVAMYNQLTREISPLEEQRVGKQLTRDIGEKAKEVMEIEGDPSVARQALGDQGSQTVRRAIDRAAESNRQAEEALEGLGVAEDPSAMSKSAKDKVNTAKKDAKKAADLAWEDAGLKLPGNYGSTGSKVQDILSRVDAPHRKEAIPDFVYEEIERAASQGATLNDIKGLRSKVLARIRAIKSDPEQASNEKWLREIEESLLDDMYAVQGADPEKIDKARYATDYLVNTFKQGNIGRLFRQQPGKTPLVADADTLGEVTAGKNAAANIENMVKAVPESAEDIQQFLRHSFATAATPQGKFNLPAANRHIASLRKRRIFEQFPELEDEFINATAKNKRAAMAQKRKEIAKGRGGARMERNVNKSLARTYSDEGAGILLDPKTKNPVLLAKRLKTRMRGNEAAEDGLRRDFLDSIHDASITSIDDHGNGVPNVGQFSKLINSNENVMRSLGFSDDHIKGLKELATMMRQAEAGAAQSGIDIFDPAGWMLNRAARFAGANAGALMNRTLGGGGAGPSLQAAQMGASAGAQAAKVMRLDPARKKVFEALTENPELLQELLLYDRTGSAARKAARSRLNAWLMGEGLDPLEDEDFESE